jgi:hypothetical protein
MLHFVESKHRIRRIFACAVLARICAEFESDRTPKTRVLLAGTGYEPMVFLDGVYQFKCIRPSSIFEAL